MKKLIKQIQILIFILFSSSFSQEIDKPFVLQHIFHKHKIDFTHALVLQNIDNYTALYNTIHILGRFNLTEKDFIFINLSKTFGNGIAKKLEREGFSITSTGDDLEDYLKDINNTGRDYLLEFFYQREFDNLIITAGLIDATSFIDANEYANDEHTQFLNPVFINNPIALLPSYNLGASVHLKLTKNLETTALYMENKPDKGNVGIIEIEFTKDNYTIRPYYFYLFNAYEYKGFGLSADYNINDKIGLFTRVGNSTGDYKFFGSLGFRVLEIIKNDKIGFAYGYINGKNQIKSIYIYEGYYLINILKNFSITFDIQHIREEKSKFIYGIRTYFYF